MKILFLLLFCFQFIGTIPLYAKKIGLLIVATGKYDCFVDPLIQSARKYFCPEDEVTYYVFSDGQITTAPDVVCIYQKRLGWPYDTLLRNEIYSRHKELFKKEDYLFALDADMLFVDTVGKEILSDHVATRHPGFLNQRGSYETKAASLACVKNNEGTVYYAGGFFGGSKERFFHIIETTTKRINQDLQNGVIAVWHDESHWNRYCIDYPPTLILDPSYCYPESWHLPFPKKLLALDKAHNVLRSQNSSSNKVPINLEVLNQLKEKPIVVIIPSYNNSRWVANNIKSILAQNYTNFRIIYIDDQSKDDTSKKVSQLVLKSKRKNEFNNPNKFFQQINFDDSGTEDIVKTTELFKEKINKNSCFFTLIQNKNRCGALCNLYRAIQSSPDNAIIVTVDGDDWLAHKNVLKELNTLYSEKEIYLTHGKLITFPSGETTWCEPIPSEVVASNTFRKYKCPSHLRTFYAWLFKKIHLEDLLYQGKFFAMTGDMAIMYPMIEMAGEKHAFIEKPNYVYNVSNNLNDNKVNPELQRHLDHVIRNKDRYSSITGFIEK